MKTHKPYDKSYRLILLAMLIGPAACAVETGQDGAGAETSSDGPVVAVSEALTGAASSPLRVLIIGNSQLGYQNNMGAAGDQQNVAGAVLQEISERSNMLGSPAVPAAPMDVHVYNPGGYASCDPSRATPIATIPQFDVVILQPSMTDFNANGALAGVTACWDEYRNKAVQNGREFGLLSTVTAPGNYAAQSDVAMETAMRNYAAQSGTLMIPASSIIRAIIGPTLSSAAQTSWYSDTAGHPTSRGHYTYAAALYQYISWRAAANAGPLPADLAKLPKSEFPTTSEAGSITFYAQATFINRTIAFKANGSSNKNLVTAENAGNSPLVTRTPNLGDWEKFTMRNQAGGTLAITAKVNSRYVCAENAGASALIANRDSVGDWEKFYPIRRGGDGANIALQALVNAQFVTFYGNGTTQAIANATSIGDAQKFIGLYYP
jgi:hypothetical protein